MTKFETIKELVNVPQAAERYGLNVTHGNMCLCPFHGEKTSSMKLYEKNYHCFGCGAHGDVIALAANLFDIPMLEAAKRINADFSLGLDMEKPISSREIALIQCKKQEAEDFAKRESNAWLTLAEYFSELCHWRTEFAPKSETEEPDERFLESLQKRDYIEHLCNVFIIGTKEERLALREEVERIEQRMCEYRRSLITRVEGQIRKAE